MPIILTNSSYTDAYGNVTNYFKANAGDRVFVKYTFTTEIFAISSNDNPMSMSKITNTLTQTQGSFLKEGFRVGQTYTFKDVNNSNSVTATYTGTILAVTDFQLTLTGLPNTNNSSSQGSTWCIYVEQVRSSIELGVNFVDNTLVSPTLDSLLDGEENRFVVKNVNSMGINSTQFLTQIGKKSGGILFQNALLKRVDDVYNPYTFSHNKQTFELSFYCIFHGMFDETWFTGQNCLKIYSKIDFRVTDDDALGVSTLEIKDGSDTGFFNSGFNTEVPNVILTSVYTNSVFYNTETSIPFEIRCNNTSINSIQFGAMYVTLDDFNKNKPLSQRDYLSFAQTPLWNSTNVNQYVNSSAKEFILKLESFSSTTSSGTKTFTGSIQIEPFYGSGDFGDFIESRGDNDRLFYIWAKVGNTNTLLFGGQLEYQQPVGLLIEPSLTTIFNHNHNSDYSDLSLPPEDFNFNIEDDLGFVADFLLSESDSNDSISVKIIATNESISNPIEIDLEEITFDVSNKDLNYFVPTYLDVGNNLPQSSSKKRAYLIQKTPIFRGSLEVRLYYPFLIRWESWINQQNVPAYFVKALKDNKNWYNYQIGNPNWKVKVKVEIFRNGVVDYFYTPFSFKNYEDSTIVSDIKLYTYPENVLSSSLKPNSIMIVEAKHIFPSNYTMTPWGQITIEPSESSPRHVLSTEIDRSTSNPMYGIGNEPRLDIDYVSSTEIILRCLIDTNKLTGTNYCFTSKISDSGTGTNDVEDFKITEDNIEKITEDTINKIIE